MRRTLCWAALGAGLASLAAAGATPAPSASPTPLAPLRVLVMDWITDWTSSNPSLELYSPVVQQSIAVHFLLAAQHWNERNAGALPVLGTVSAQCPNISIVNYCDEAGNDLVAARHVVEYQNEIDVIVGFQSKAVESSSVLAAAVGEIPVVSYWTTESELDNKNFYPLYARVALSDAQYIDPLAKFLQVMGYDQVSVIVLDQDEGPSYLDSLRSVFYENNITYLAFTHVFNDSTSIRSALQRIKDADLNIIIVATYETDITENFAPLAESMGLNGPDHLWIFTNFDIAVSPGEAQASPLVNKLMLGSVRIDTQLGNSTLYNKFTANWPMYEHYLKSFNTIFPPHGSVYDGTNDVCRYSTIDFALPFGFFNDSSVGSQGVAGIVGAWAYDSVISTALAACVSPGNYGANLWANLVNNVSFNGLSGPVDFDPISGSRVPTNFNLRATLYRANLSQFSLGYFDGTSWYVNLSVAPFKSGLGNPPVQITPSVEFMNYLPDGLRYVAVAEVVVMFALCLTLTGWLVRKRYTRVVVQSQPIFMYIVLLGSCISTLAVLGLAVDEGTPYSTKLGCNEPPVVFSFGFLLALTALWGKTIRLRSVFSGSTLHVGLTVSVVMMRVGVIMAIQIVWLVVFLVAAPLVWRRVVTSYDSHGFPLTSLGSCYASSAGTGVFLACLFFMCVAVLAHTSRVATSMKNVPEEFQEARWISTASTVLLQMALLSVPVVFAVYDFAIGRFVILSSLAFFANLTLIVIIFFPKVFHRSPVRIGDGTRSHKGLVGGLGVIEGLQIPRIRQKFERFAAEAMTIEHVHFITDVESLRERLRRAGAADEGLRRDALALVKIYIRQGSMMQVNISSKVRENLEKAAAAPDSNLETIFDEAETEVTNLLNFGAWLDFVEDGGLFGLDQEVNAALSQKKSNSFSSSDVGAGGISGLVNAASQALQRIGSRPGGNTGTTGSLGNRKHNSNLGNGSRTSNLGSAGSKPTSPQVSKTDVTMGRPASSAVKSVSTEGPSTHSLGALTMVDEAKKGGV